MMYYPDEMNEIFDRVEPYMVRKGLEWHWADNTPQSIKDDWQKFVDWEKEIRDSHLAVGTII